MLVETDSFRQEFEISAQYLEALRQQLDLLPDRQGTARPAVEGLAEALLALKQAHDSLSRQNQACAACCQGLETELATYRDLFENAPHARLLTDLSGAIRVANTPASILFRASQDALTGEQLAAFLPQPARESLSEHLAQLQAGGVLHGWEVCLQPASGDAVEVSLDAVTVHDQQHRLVGLQWLLRDISRQVQAEEALRHSESKYRMLVDSLHEGVWLLDKDDCTTFANPRMADMLGCTVDEMLGAHLFTFVGEEQLDLARARMARRRQGIKEAVDFEFRRKDGTPLYANIEVTPLFDDHGQYAGALAAVADMTEHRRVDEERERLLAQATRDRQRAEELAATSQRERDTLQAVMESTRAQVAYLDPQFNFLLVNTAYIEWSGHAKEELLGRNHFDLFPSPENQEIFERVRDTGQPVEYRAKPFEFIDQPERGTTYWDWTLMPVKSSAGEVEGLVLSSYDVTRQVRDGQYIDSLRAQAQRQADELGAILNAIPDAVAVWDAQGAVLRANPAAAALGIWTDQTGMVGTAERLKVRHANGRPVSAQELPVARALHGEVIQNETEILVNPAGEEQEILVSAAPVFSGGEIVACVVAAHDITDKRRAEMERERLLAENRSQREFLERLVEAAPVGIAVLRGPEHRHELANPYYRAMTGAPGRPIIGRTIVEAIPDLAARGMPPLMDQVYRTGRTVSTREVRLPIGPGREETYWNTDRVPLQGPDGAVEGILVLAHDVTREVQYRQRIEALGVQAQQQAAELEAVFAALVDPVTVYDSTGAILRANPAAVESLGLDPVGLSVAAVGQNVSVRYPDGQPIPADELVAARALHGETVRDEPQLIVRARGDERAIMTSAAPIVSGGHVAGAVAVWHDITELRRAEEALRQVNERLEFALAASGAGSWDWDIPSDQLEWSPKLFDLYGLDMKTTPATFDVWRSVLHPQDREAAERRINLALETRSDLASEYRIIQPDGRLRWISALGRGVYDDQGRPSRMSGLCLDITDRKLAEAKVEHLSSFPQLNPNPVLEIDASGTIVFHNASAAKTVERLGLGDGARAFLPGDLAAILQELDQQKETAFQREVQVGSATFAETVQVIPAFNVVRIYAFEITKRKKAEEALRRSEERFRLALKHAPVTVAAQDRDLRFVWAYNQRTVPPSEVIGKTDTDLFPPETAARLLALKRQVLETGAELADRMWVSSGGQQVYVDLYLEPIRNEDGEIEGVGVATVNLTERKRAEDALRSAQLQAEDEKRHLEAVLQALPVGVVITDAQGGVLLANGMDAQIWGPRPITHDVGDYVQYKAWWADSGKPVEPHEWASAQAVQKGESVFGQVLEIERLDGGHRVVLNSAVPIRDVEGRVIGSAVAVQDITELRRAEQALRESEERFRTVVENSRDGINLLDLQTGRYVFMSPAQVKLTGFSAEEINNWPVEEAYDRIHPDDREKSVSQQREIAEGRDQGSTVEYRWKVKSGEYRWFSDSRTLVRDEQGRAVALVGVSRDITDQKRAQEELRRKEAELAQVSHERAIAEERQRLARELHDSVSQALYGISLGVNTAVTLLDSNRDKVLEALDYSLSQAQAALADMRALIFALRPEALATEGVVAALRKETAALVARSNIEIELGSCDEPDVSFEVKEALYRIAQEALQNAVKHARCSRIRVRLTCERDGLSLEVRDDGVGFDPLASYPGHLGLHSMRERAMSVGGTLEIVSAPNCGTQIRVQVPVPAARPASSA